MPERVYLFLVSSRPRCGFFVSPPLLFFFSLPPPLPPLFKLTPCTRTKRNVLSRRYATTGTARVSGQATSIINDNCSTSLMTLIKGSSAIPCGELAPIFPSPLFLFFYVPFFTRPPLQHTVDSPYASRMPILYRSTFGPFAPRVTPRRN